MTGDQVQVSIRVDGRSLACLPEAAFTRLTPLWMLYDFTPCCNIKKTHAGCSLNFTTKSMRGTEKKEARGEMYEHAE